jgi:hypothetical protein
VVHIYMDHKSLKYLYLARSEHEAKKMARVDQGL